jgi:hypothetical protein
MLLTNVGLIFDEIIKSRAEAEVSRQFFFSAVNILKCVFIIILIFFRSLIFLELLYCLELLSVTIITIDFVTVLDFPRH